MAEFKKSEYDIKEITCPSCQKTARVITHLLDIPYYTDFVMINMSCPSCGYRSSDFMNLNAKGHIVYEYPIEEESDGTTKVVRSNAGTVIIPELGIRIEPVSEGMSWIRNIEGILLDIEQKLKITLEQYTDPADKKEVQARLDLLNKMLNFEIPFTIIVDDPYGNSLILPAKQEKLKKQVISENSP